MGSRSTQKQQIHRRPSAFGEFGWLERGTGSRGDVGTEQQPSSASVGWTRWRNSGVNSREAVHERRCGVGNDGARGGSQALVTAIDAATAWLESSSFVAVEAAACVGAQARCGRKVVPSRHHKENYDKDNHDSTTTSLDVRACGNNGRQLGDRWRYNSIARTATAAVHSVSRSVSSENGHCEITEFLFGYSDETPGFLLRHSIEKYGEISGFLLGYSDETPGFLLRYSVEKYCEISGFLLGYSNETPEFLLRLSDEKYCEISGFSSDTFG
ncbi:hypothetical protein NL676_013753 [Syzygium grande]|nr:hypothetical protein NL676_013753 [Syzygium grande]